MRSTLTVALLALMLASTTAEARPSMSREDERAFAEIAKIDAACQRKYPEFRMTWKGLRATDKRRLKVFTCVKDAVSGKYPNFTIVPTGL